VNLPDKVKNEIVWYLENYWGVVTTIADKRNSIIYARVMADLDVPIRGSETSDIPQKKAVKLTELELDTMTDWIKTINESYHWLIGNDKQKAQLMRMVYLDKNPEYKTRNRIIDNLYMDKNTFYRYLDDIYGVIGLKAASKKLIDT
jgi:hypothetical protein